MLTFGALVAVLAAAGCGGSDDGGDDGTAVKVAYLTYTVADYQKAIQRGLRRAIASNRGTVTVLNANFDAQKQQQQCQDAVQSGRYNAMVLGAVDAATGVPCVRLAKDADLPVVTIENAVGKDPNVLEPQVDGVVKSILTTPDDNAAGLRDLVKLACEGKDPCKAIVEIATPTDRMTISVPKLIRATVPNAQIVQTIATQYDPNALAKSLPDALSSHPDADVFVSIADFQALAAAPVVREAGKTNQLKLIGNGASSSGVAAVKKGTLFGTLGTWPEQWGRMAGEALTQAVNGDDVDGPAGVDGFSTDEPSRVTKENAAEFKPEWG